MSEKFKILAQFIKDMSSETPNAETFLYVKEYLGNYNLKIDISSKPADVAIEGELTIHGVKKSIKESGRIWYNEDKISGQCKFNIAVADYNIKIPRIVRENIAKIIEVSVNVTLKRK